MTVLACYNLKGGVGKTATAVNLAWLAAQEGRRVLLWDLDPQGAATWTLRVRPKVRGGARGLVERRHDPVDHVRGTDHDNLDVLPADFRYRDLDLRLGEVEKPRRVLGALLGELAGDYDLIVLDCPPSLSLVSENVFRAADALVVPLIPTTLSVRTLEQLVDFARQGGLDALAILPFFTLVDRRKRLHAEVMAALPARFPVLTTRVPDAAHVENMSSARAPVGVLAPGSEATAAYAALWEEVKGRLGM